MSVWWWQRAMGGRVCPHDPKMTTCWWVKVGHPHGGEGHACVCLIPVERWTVQPLDQGPKK